MNPETSSSAEPQPPPYQALLVVSFGGPESKADVIPFLENVLRGRNVPRERMLAVAEHYYHFDGVSPINAQNRALIAALERDFAEQGLQLPIYWGNRNWRPMLDDTLRQMADDGIVRALALVTSAYSSYSSCRQYRENIEAAQRTLPGRAPQVDKLRVFYNHPGFIEPMVEHVQTALNQIPAERRQGATLLFTAHSIPISMASTSRYVEQLEEASRLVAEALGHAEWRLVYQSRSGAPGQPWLEPDVCEVLKDLARASVRDVVAVPIGFISDHMEVLYDLDTEASEVARGLGMNFVRASTVGVHPKFVAMIRELVLERMDPSHPRQSYGRFGPSHDVCAPNCCPAPQRMPSATAPAQAE